MRTTITMATIAVLMTFQVHAASVTHTFQNGDPAVASEINQNFQDVVDAINSGGGSTSFGAEWFLSSSSDGALTARNVIVLKGDRGGDNANGSCNEDVYRVHVSFDNTAGISVSNGSGSNVPAEVFIFGFVCADRGGATVTYQQEYRYGLPDSDTVGYFGAYEQGGGVEINEDFNADGLLDDQNNSYDAIFNLKRSSIGSSEYVHQVELYRNGSQTLVANNFSYVMSSFDSSLQIGAPLNQTFSNVAVRTFSDYSSGKARLRFHAQNIGVVQQIDQASFDDPVYNNQVQYNAIYYRVEGQGTAGSLAGTPFDGGAAAGVWFQQ